MAGGRPSEFTKEIKVKTADYLKECLENNKVPSIARLAVTLNVSKNSLYNWGEQDPEFLNTLDQLKQIQEAMLLENGLTGKYNATIVKLMLANYGYRDRQDITSDDKAIRPSLVEFVGEDTTSQDTTTG